jgi:hypothetical protein
MPRAPRTGPAFFFVFLPGVTRPSVVARVASKLFAVPISESNVVVETLERITEPTANADSVRAALGRLIDEVIPSNISDEALRKHPLAIWVETRLGVTFSQLDQRWVRAKPMTVYRGGHGSVGRRRASRGGMPRRSAPVVAHLKCSRKGPNFQFSGSRNQFFRVQTPSVHLRCGPCLLNTRATRPPHRYSRRPAIPARTPR